MVIGHASRGMPPILEFKPAQECSYNRKLINEYMQGK